MPAIRGSSRIFPVGAASSITGPAGVSGPTGATGATGSTGNAGPTGVMGTYIVATGASGGPGNSYGNDFITFFLVDGTTIGVSGAAGNAGDSQSTNTYYTIVNESELIEHGQLFREIDGATAFFHTITVSGNDITARYDGDTIMLTGNTYDFGFLGLTGELALGPSAAGAKNTHYDGDTLLMRILNHREIYDNNNINTPAGTSRPTPSGAGATGGNTFGTSTPFINIVNDQDVATLPEGVTAMYSGIHAGQMSNSDGSSADVYYGFPGITFSDITKDVGLGNDPFGSCCYCQGSSDSDDSYNCLNYVTEQYCNAINGVYSISSCLDRPEGPNCNSAGACCVNGTCVAANEDRCREFGGFYVDDMSCSEIYEIGGCPSSCGNSGVCCVLGQCYDTDPLGCDYLGGNWTPGTCANDGQRCCDQRISGACCLEEICYDTSPATCAAIIEDDTDNSELGACCFTVDDSETPVMVFSYDESGSMGGEEEVVVAFTEDIIDGIQSNNVNIPIGSTLWSTTVNNILNPVPYSQHQSVVTFISQEYNANGGTQFLPAIVANNTMISDYACTDEDPRCAAASNAIVLFLADGTGSSADLYEILSNYDNPNFPLGKYVTVGYGAATENEEARALLQALADSTGGVYFEAPDPAGLQSIIEFISGEVGFCEQKTWFSCQRPKWFIGEECTESICDRSNPSSRGACCRFGGSCEDNVQQSDCINITDTWYGPGTECESIDCGSYTGGGASRGVFWGPGSYCAGPEGPYEWSFNPVLRRGWLQFEPGSEYDVCDDGVGVCPCQCDNPGIPAQLNVSSQQESSPIEFRQGGEQGEIVCRCGAYVPGECGGSWIEDGRIVMCANIRCDGSDGGETGVGACQQPTGEPGPNCEVPGADCCLFSGSAGGPCSPGCLIGGDSCLCNGDDCDCTGSGNCDCSDCPEECPPGFPGGGADCPGCQACQAGDMDACGDAVNCCQNGNCEDCPGGNCCGTSENPRPCGDDGDYCVPGTCNPGLCCVGGDVGSPSGMTWGNPGQCESCGCPAEADGSCYEEHSPGAGCTDESCCELVCGTEGYAYCCTSSIQTDDDGNIIGPGWDENCARAACTLCRDCCINDDCDEGNSCIDGACQPDCDPTAGDTCGDCDQDSPTPCDCEEACAGACEGSNQCGCTSDDDCNANLCCGTNQKCVDCDGGGGEGCTSDDDCDDPYGYCCGDLGCKTSCEDPPVVDPPHDTGSNTYPCGTIVLADKTCWSCCYSGDLPDRTCSGELSGTCIPCCYGEPGDESCTEQENEDICIETGGTPIGVPGDRCDDINCSDDDIGNCCFSNGSGCVGEAITENDCMNGPYAGQVIWKRGDTCADCIVRLGSCCSVECQNDDQCDGVCGCATEELQVTQNDCQGVGIWDEGSFCDSYCPTLQGVADDIGVCCYADGRPSAFTTEEECIGPEYCHSVLQSYQTPGAFGGGADWGSCNPDGNPGVGSECCGKRRNHWADVDDCLTSGDNPDTYFDCSVDLGTCCYPAGISSTVTNFGPYGISCKLALSEEECDLAHVTQWCPENGDCEDLPFFDNFASVSNGGVLQYTPTFTEYGTDCTPASQEDCRANYYGRLFPDDGTENPNWDGCPLGQNAEALEIRKYEACIALGASSCEQKGTCCRSYSAPEDTPPTDEDGWWNLPLDWFRCDEEESDGASCCLSRDNRDTASSGWTNCRYHGGSARACSSFSNTEFTIGTEDDCDNEGCGDTVPRVRCCEYDIATGFINWTAADDPDAFTRDQCLDAGGVPDVWSGQCEIVDCCRDGVLEQDIEWFCSGGGGGTGEVIDEESPDPATWTVEEYFCQTITCCSNNQCLGGDRTRNQCFDNDGGSEIPDGYDCETGCELRACCTSNSCEEKTWADCDEVNGTRYLNIVICEDTGDCEFVDCCTPSGTGAGDCNSTRTRNQCTGDGDIPDIPCQSCSADVRKCCVKRNDTWTCENHVVTACEDLENTDTTIQDTEEAEDCDDCILVNCCTDVEVGTCNVELQGTCTSEDVGGTVVENCTQNCGRVDCCLNGEVVRRTRANCGNDCDTGSCVIDDMPDVPSDWKTAWDNWSGNPGDGTTATEAYYCNYITCCTDRGCGDPPGEGCVACGEEGITRYTCFNTPLTYQTSCGDCSSTIPVTYEASGQVVVQSSDGLSGMDVRNQRGTAGAAATGYEMQFACNHQSVGCWSSGCCLNGQCVSLHKYACEQRGGFWYPAGVTDCNNAENCSPVTCCFEDTAQCVTPDSVDPYYTKFTCEDAGGNSVVDCSECNTTTVNCCYSATDNTCVSGEPQTVCSASGGVEVTSCGLCKEVGCCTGGGETPFAGCDRVPAYDCDGTVIYDPGAGSWNDDTFNAECDFKCEAINCCIEGEDNVNVCYDDGGSQDWYYSENTCSGTVLETCDICATRKCCRNSDPCDVSCVDSSEQDCLDAPGNWAGIDEDPVAFCIACLATTGNCADCCVGGDTNSPQCYRDITLEACRENAGCTTEDDESCSSTYEHEVNVCDGGCGGVPLGCCCTETGVNAGSSISSYEADCVDENGVIKSWTSGSCVAGTCALRPCCKYEGNINDWTTTCDDTTPANCDNHAPYSPDGDYSAFCTTCANNEPADVGTCCYFWPPEGYGFSTCDDPTTCSGPPPCAPGCFEEGGLCKGSGNVECPCSDPNNCFGCMETCCSQVLLTEQECRQWWNCWGTGEANSGACLPTLETIPGFKWTAETSTDCSGCDFDRDNGFASCCVGTTCIGESITQYECEILNSGTWNGDREDTTCGACSSCELGASWECNSDDDCELLGDNLGCCCGCCAIDCQYDMCGELGRYVDTQPHFGATRWIGDNPPDVANSSGRLIVFKQGQEVDGTGEFRPIVNRIRKHFGRVEWYFVDGTFSEDEWDTDGWNVDNWIGWDELNDTSYWGNYVAPDRRGTQGEDEGSLITLTVTNHNTEATYTYTTYSSRGTLPGAVPTRYQISANIWTSSCVGPGCPNNYNGNINTDPENCLWGWWPHPEDACGGDDPGETPPSFTVTYQPLAPLSTCCTGWGTPSAACSGDNLVTEDQCPSGCGPDGTESCWGIACANCIDVAPCCINQGTCNAAWHENEQHIGFDACDSISNSTWDPFGTVDCEPQCNCCKNKGTIDQTCLPPGPSSDCEGTNDEFGSTACNDCNPLAPCCSIPNPTEGNWSCDTTVLVEESECPAVCGPNLNESCWGATCGGACITPTNDCCSTNFTCTTETQFDCESGGGTWGSDACADGACKAPPALGYCCVGYETTGACNGNTEEANCPAVCGPNLNESCWTDASTADGCNSCPTWPTGDCCIGGPDYPWKECHTDVTQPECDDLYNDHVDYWKQILGDAWETSASSYFSGNPPTISSDGGRTCSQCGHEDGQCCIRTLSGVSICASVPMGEGFPSVLGVNGYGNTAKGCSSYWTSTFDSDGTCRDLNKDGEFDLLAGECGDWSYESTCGEDCTPDPSQPVIRDVCPPGHMLYPYTWNGSTWVKTDPYTTCCSDDQCTDDDVCDGFICSDPPPEPDCTVATQSVDCTASGLPCCDSTTGTCVSCCDLGCPADTPSCSDGGECQTSCGNGSDITCGENFCCDENIEGHECVSCSQNPAPACCPSEGGGLEWNLDPASGTDFDPLHAFYGMTPNCVSMGPANGRSDLELHTACNDYCQNQEGWDCVVATNFCEDFLGTRFNHQPGTPCSTNGNVWWRVVHGGNPDVYPNGYGGPHADGSGYADPTVDSAGRYRMCCCDGQGNSVGMSASGNAAPGPAMVDTFNNAGDQHTETSCEDEGGTWVGFCLKPDIDKGKLLGIVSNNNCNSLNNDYATWPVDVNYFNGTCMWAMERIFWESDDDLCGPGGNINPASDSMCPGIMSNALGHRPKFGQTWGGGTNNCYQADADIKGVFSSYIDPGTAGLIDGVDTNWNWTTSCTGQLDNAVDEYRGQSFSCLFQECYEYLCSIKEQLRYDLNTGSGRLHPWMAPNCVEDGCSPGLGSCDIGSIGSTCYCFNNDHGIMPAELQTLVDQTETDYPTSGGDGTVSTLFDMCGNIEDSCTRCSGG